MRHDDAICNQTLLKSRSGILARVDDGDSVVTCLFGRLHVLFLPVIDAIGCRMLVGS